MTGPGGWDDRIARARNYLWTATLGGGFVGMLGALAHFIGRQDATVAAAVACGALVVVAAQAAWRVLRLIHDNLAPNGHEELMPPELRGKPLREVQAWTVAHVQRIERRLEQGDGRFDGLEHRVERLEFGAQR